MEIRHQLFESENLFVQKYNGIFSIDKYQKYTRYVAERFAMAQIKKVLIDFRGLVFNNNPDEFNQNLNKVIEIRKTINDTELINKDITLVFWVDKPLPTVIVQLFSANFPNYNYCSTKEIVIKNLMLPGQLHDLDSIIKKLENTFNT